MITFEVDIEIMRANEIFRWLMTNNIEYNEVRSRRMTININSYLKVYHKYFISMDDSNGTAFELSWRGRDETFYNIVGATRVREPFVRQDILT